MLFIKTEIRDLKIKEIYFINIIYLYDKYTQILKNKLYINNYEGIYKT